MTSPDIKRNVRSSITILLIDDSAPVRAVLRIGLEFEGYQIMEAADGREGARLYREHRPAVAIVEIVMPEKGGLETLREIMAFDPDAIVFTLSGQDAGGDYQETARMLGAKRSFGKPPVLEDFLKAIREATRHSGLIGKVVALVLMDKRGDGTDDWAVLAGPIIRQGQALSLDRGPDQKPLQLEEEWVTRATPVPEDARSGMQNAEYYIPLSVGPLPEDADSRKYRSLDLKWPE